LGIYQLLKRNRITLLDPTYDPELEVTASGQVKLTGNPSTSGWKSISQARRLRAIWLCLWSGVRQAWKFCAAVRCVRQTRDLGWPDVGRPDVERSTENQAIYIDCINRVRSHLGPLINPEKTELTVYLNGLDESYFPEAWDRMVFYGDLFRKYYPEARFRIDGGYSEEAMQVVKNSITAWASHTIEYDYEIAKKYQDMGIRIWLYGPMLHESKVNSQ
jgi:hypothetical protein